MKGHQLTLAVVFTGAVGVLIAALFLHSDGDRET
jgi:hypothetical protein